MRPQHQSNSNSGFRIKRVQVWYALLLIACSIFVLRLFYLQVIKHDYYQMAAASKQLKEYEIPAERGIIEAHDGDKTVPIVLNETRYTLFADPLFVKDPAEAARAVAAVIGGDVGEYEDKMRQTNRYAILAKKLDEEQKRQLDALELKGIGTREQDYRTYPQGSLAAQLLGFVNDEGKGVYGIEQYLDEELRGMPGQLKAITDAAGVPLVSNADNVIAEPQAGKRVLLNIDLTMQKLLEDFLKEGLEHARSDFGSVLIMEAQTGAVKAMANYPSYNPAEFYGVKDAKRFNNAAVSEPMEIGSIMKPLTVAAGLNEGVIGPDDTFYDPGYVRLDGATVKNVEGTGGGTRSITDILRFSLNTGAVHILAQLGGGEVNDQARKTWHEYMTERYRLGKPTGIEQGYEAEGYIPDPNEGYGLNIQYANTSFGQGMTATILQTAAAYAAIVNGGTYYRPQLVDAILLPDGTRQDKRPEVLSDNVVADKVSSSIRHMLEQVPHMNNRAALRDGYSVGGKTGTAQVPSPDGGYYEDRFHGTYAGFVGGNEAEYVIVVRVDAPKIGGYAGTTAAAPIFSKASNMLIDNFGVSPRH